MVRYIGNGLGHSTEGRRRLYPAHGAGHWDGHQRGFPFVAGDDDSEAGAIIGPYE